MLLVLFDESGTLSPGILSKQLFYKQINLYCRIASFHFCNAGLALMVQTPKIADAATPLPHELIPHHLPLLWRNHLYNAKRVFNLRSTSSTADAGDRQINSAFRIFQSRLFT